MSSDIFAASLRQWLRDSAWLDKLRGAVDNMPEGDSVSRDSIRFFFDSINRLNAGIGFLKTFAALPEDPETLALIDRLAGKIHDAFHSVFDLAAKLDPLLNGDTPVSQGIAHARSWSRIVLENCKPISFWIENGVIISRQHLDGIVYDSGLVSEHLEIELERVLKRVDPLARSADAGKELLKRTAKKLKVKHRKNSEELFKGALKTHHKYEAGGSVMNYEPISARQIETMTERAISDSTAWRLLKKHFGGVQKYKDACLAETIGHKLVVLLGDGLHAFGTNDPTRIKVDTEDDADSDD